jgi:hypothetical protein
MSLWRGNFVIILPCWRLKRECSDKVRIGYVFRHFRKPVTPEVWSSTLFKTSKFAPS